MTAVKKMLNPKEQDKGFRALSSRREVIKTLVTNGVTPGTEDPWEEYEQAKRLVFEGRRFSPRDYHILINWICSYLRI